MELSFIFYVLISIIVISGSLYFNSRPGAMSGAIVMALLFLLISIFFGMRWFTISGGSNLGTNISTTWPPPNSINMCPDYLTLTTGSGTNPVYTCIDTKGISRIGPNQSVILNEPSGTNVNYRATSALCSDCYTKGITWEGVCIPNSDAPLRADIVPPRPS